MTDEQIIYECDAKNCEQCSPSGVCCECKNIACYELEKQLKAENEELKEQLELNTANAVVIDMAQRLYKLKQTLQEIKDYCNKYPQNSIGFKKHILQKISECEVIKDEKI